MPRIKGNVKGFVFLILICISVVIYIALGFNSRNFSPVFSNHADRTSVIESEKEIVEEFSSATNASASPRSSVPTNTEDSNNKAVKKTSYAELNSASQKARVVDYSSLYADAISLLEDPETNTNSLKALKLGSIFHYCAQSYSSERELEMAKQQQEKIMLLRGKGNGEIEKELATSDMHYKQCSMLASVLSGDDFIGLKYDYLKFAAKAGSIDAIAHLAMLPPPNFDSWSDKKKKEYRSFVSNVLLDARKRCDPGAFNLYSSQAKLGETWYDLTRDSARIAPYANHWAKSMFYAKNVDDLPEDYLKDLARRQGALASEYGLSEKEVFEAMELGSRIYHEYCAQ